MRVLLLNDLHSKRTKPALSKVLEALRAGDFRSADVKKMQGTGYWRAKLNHSDRLLLQFARFGGETVCLVLEVIENHAYDKSRFLRGAAVDEAKIDQQACTPDPTDPALQAESAQQKLRWLHPSRNVFDLLDKPLMFDDTQEAVRRLPAPVVVVGSAGSGKTAVTLTKLREAEGHVLYVTQSAYLAQSARSVYQSHGFENAAQEVEFLSFKDFIETLQVPQGRELQFANFSVWFERQRPGIKATLGDLDAHAVFEEFRGVIGASPSGALSLPDYLALGKRQSLLDASARQAAHALFDRYKLWLKEANLFDLNLLAFDWRAHAAPTYDFIVIDEVQDLTPVQLALVLACLQKPGQFLLCGDSNQIVHPNFFSWAAVRSLFWHGLAGEHAVKQQSLQVLQANFRNTRTVTELANSLLKIKQARFGSIDRESNFLVQSASIEAGEVRLLQAKDAVVRDLDAKTRASVHHAVVVLRDEDKALARQAFRTPLVFSVHEAKGLEYPHVILYALVSNQRQAFAELCEGVTPADLHVNELNYSRAKDKGDKSLELYKFYVNALYVAITRAVQSLVIVESDTAHPLLQLLGLKLSDGAGLGQTNATSSKEEWAQEARKLELQGKQEQAQAIRNAFLKHPSVPWTPWSQQHVQELAMRALDPSSPSSKPRQTLMDYALWHGQQAWVEKLAVQVGFAPARAIALDGTFGGSPPEQWDFHKNYGLSHRTMMALRQRHLQQPSARNFKDLLHQCNTYGIDHRTYTGGTTLMLAARAGNVALVDALLERGADTSLQDEFGHTAWLVALNRALDDPDFAKQHLGPLFDRLAPSAFDVQVDAKMIRLQREQAEYWVLSLMLAGFKGLHSKTENRGPVSAKLFRGFYAEFVETVLASLPAYLWAAARRKRSYINHVLARAEVTSSYTPARKLWVRTVMGHYIPNPALQLRQPEPTAASEWKPIYAVLNLDWVKRGTQQQTVHGPASVQDLLDLVQAKIGNSSLDKTEPEATPAAALRR